MRVIERVHYHRQKGSGTPVATRLILYALVAAVLALVFLALKPMLAHAAGTYYVDIQNPSASDANPGTAALPYRTITAAAAAHNGPGTVILVRPGLYRETVTVPASGDSTNPFVFRATDPGVVIDGADDFSDPAKWVPASGTVYLAAAVTWSPLQVLVDGARLAPSTAGPAALPAGSFQYVAGAGLYVNLGGASPGVRQTLIGRRLYGIRITNLAGVQLDGFTVTRTEDKGIFLTGAANCVVRNNTVSFSRKYGIYVTGGSAGLIEKNTVSDHQFHGIGLLGGATGMTVQDNEGFRNADPGTRVANGLFVSGASGNLIRRNRWHDNQDSGEQLSAGADNNLEIQNLSWNNGDRGFDHLDSKGAVMIGCVAFGNTNDGLSFDGASSGGQIYDCIAADNGLTTNRFDLWVSSLSAPGLASDFNLLWNSTAQPPVKYIATAYASVAAFGAASGTDGRTLQANPRFANAATGDFHLLAGSPAIDDANAGLSAWPATDADGMSRLDDPATPNTGVGPVLYGDRGAYEYRAATQVPTAVLTVTPSSGTESLDVVADGAGSSDADGSIASYRFDFGDGEIDGPQATPTAYHTYAAGNWTVTLTVRDNDGYTNSASRTVSVLPSNQAPNGTIDSPASAITIAAGQAVMCAGSGVDPDANLPLSYAWSFGGGAPGVAAEDPGPVIFNTPGTYTVAFTVTDALGLADPTPATRVVTVTPAPTGLPADEIHWTLTGQNSVTLDWRGFDTAVRYGTTTAYGSTATAVTPSPLPFSSPGPFREARIAGLAENTLYHYSIGTGPDHTFRTPPPRGTSGFTIFAEGDIGASNDFSKVPVMQAAIAGDRPAFVLMIGDLTYGNSTSQASVDQHFNDVMVWSQDAAYMPAWGNHEWESAGDDLRNYRGRFDPPHPQTSPGSPGPGGEDWSWFDYGNVRFIAYPEPYSSASWSDWRAQAGTLMDQAQADPQIRFIVTYGHRPGYSSGYHGDDGIRAYLDALGSTHAKYVLNLNGHSHDYERSFPQLGVTHITAGTGGSDLEPVAGTCVWGGGCPAPSWSAFRAMHFVSMRLRFEANGILGEAICGPPDPVGDLTCTQGSILDRFVIGTLDVAPVVSAPASATVDENGTLTLNVTASDPDGNPITSLTAAPLPAGATFTPGAGNTSGTLRWTPGYTQAGTCTVTFTAANAMSGSAATTITVRNTDRAPVLTTPAGAGGLEKSLITFTVTASDPDGESISSLTASGLPTGATFSANASRTSGTFSWTPATGQNGRTTVTFTAANALSGSGSTVVTVTASGAPVVTAPATATVMGGSALTVNVTASDPNHGKISSLTAAPLPTGASFSAGAKNTSGTLTWTPTVAQAGVYDVTFTAANSQSGSATTRITVTRPDRAPVVTAPSTASVQAGTVLSLGLTASDPDGNPITSLTASNQPAGAVFATGNANTSATLTWTPAAADVGTRTVTFTASNALSGSASTAITVRPPNQPPSPALSVTPATGNAPLAVSISAAGSTDPDGSVASYRFDFGDGTSLGPQPGASATHTYAAGSWSLTVTVTDNQGATATRTLPVIAAWMPAQPNLVGNPSFETDASGWNGYSSATLARVAGGFDGASALQMTGPASLSSFGCNDAPNWVGSVPAAGIRYRSTAWVRSASSLGTARLQVREYAGATRLGGVFSSGVVLSPAWQMVTVDYVSVAAGTSLDLQVLDFPLTTGEVFLADDVSIYDVTTSPTSRIETAQSEPGAAEVIVDMSRMEPLVGRVAPSPLRTGAHLRFVTSRPGALRVTLFDLTGRRVRRVTDELNAPAGPHDLVLDGLDDRGRALASGLYFYRIRALEGVSNGRVLIAR